MYTPDSTSETIDYWLLIVDCNLPEDPWFKQPRALHAPLLLKTGTIRSALGQQTILGFSPKTLTNWQWQMKVIPINNIYICRVFLQTCDNHGGYCYRLQGHSKAYQYICLSSPTPTASARILRTPTSAQQTSNKQHQQRNDLKWQTWWTKSLKYLLAVTIYVFQLLIIPVKHLVTHTIGVASLVAHPSMRCQPFLGNLPNNAKKSRAHRLGRANSTFLDATHKALVGTSWLEFFHCET